MHLILLGCAVAAAAHASGVTNELSATATETSETNPRGSTLSDALNASFDLSDAWDLNLGAMITGQGQTAAQEQGGFGSSGSAITSFTLGADLEITGSWSAGARVIWSPESTQFTGTQVPITAGGAQANALLRSTTSQLEGAFDVSYDTAGDSALEWSFSGGLTVGHLATDQQITRVRTASGAATPQQIRDACLGRTARCPRALLAALRAQRVSLDSERLSASATAIVAQDTDVTLLGDLYLYDEDPAQVGYFSVASAGRVGNGLPLAPLRFLLRPEVTHRWGAFSAKAWVQAGQYVAGVGQGTAGVGLKLQYRFTKAFRLWATGSGQRDTDEQGFDTRSATLSLGAGYRF